jgi:peptide/nickel transport system substrate-binding protein
MGKRRQRLRLVGLALVVALLAAACGGGEKGGETPQAAPQKGGVLRTSPGNQLFPDLAADMPQISSDGLTYTFKLKPGIKFAPPVNRVITSKDVAYAFQRINTAPLVAQYGFYYFGVVKGMDGKAKSADQKISGIETPDDQTIIFHLEKPTGDFLYRVFMPATAPIPEEVAKCFTKAGDYGRYVISSGPYMIQGSDKLDISSCKAMKPISGFDPSRELKLVRNPNYDQATDNLRSNFVDSMDITINTNVDDIFNKVEAGQLDSSIVEPPPKPVLQRYVTDAAKKPYLHSNSSDATSYIFLNVTTPPFDDVNVRKAANLIMDKAAIQQAYGGTTLGDVATHIWPPIVLGDRLKADYNPYATPDNKGDEAKAKEAMKQSKYDSNKDGICDASACKGLVMINRNYSPYSDAEPVVVSSLQKIGIQVKPRELATSAAYTTVQTVKNNIPIGLNARWGKDYADPYTFAVLFISAGIAATGNNNFALVGLTPQQATEFGVKLPSGAQVPSVDGDIDACQKISNSQPDQRNDCFANVDKKLMEQVVPWVPYLWQRQITITAPSMTKFEFDQFSGYLSITQVAVNNNATLPS